MQGRWWQANEHKVRLCALEWTRKERDPQDATRGSVQQRAATNAATRKRGARRTGKAAMAGWVTCPICAKESKRVIKRYNRGSGLKQHLNSVHSKDRDLSDVKDSEKAAAVATWLEAMAAEADTLGVQLRRSAGGKCTRNLPLLVCSSDSVACDFRAG